MPYYQPTNFQIFKLHRFKKKSSFFVAKQPLPLSPVIFHILFNRIKNKITFGTVLFCFLIQLYHKQVESIVGPGRMYSAMSIDSCFCWELLKTQFRYKSITEVFVVLGHAQREKHATAVFPCEQVVVANKLFHIAFNYLKQKSVHCNWAFVLSKSTTLEI